MYDYYKNYSVFWVKDPTAENRNKSRPAVIICKSNNTYILAKITSKYKETNKYCCPLDNWFEAGLSKPSCVRLDKFINLTEKMLDKRNYIGLLEDTDKLVIRSMLDTLYSKNALTNY